MFASAAAALDAATKAPCTEPGYGSIADAAIFYIYYSGRRLTIIFLKNHSVRSHPHQDQVRCNRLPREMRALAVISTAPPAPACSYEHKNLIQLMAPLTWRTARRIDDTLDFGARTTTCCLLAHHQPEARMMRIASARMSAACRFVVYSSLRATITSLLAPGCASSQRTTPPYCACALRRRPRTRPQTHGPGPESEPQQPSPRACSSASSASVAW